MHVSCSRGNTLFRFFAKFCTVKISHFFIFIAPICPITDNVYTEHIFRSFLGNNISTRNGQVTLVLIFDTSPRVQLIDVTRNVLVLKNEWKKETFIQIGCLISSLIFKCECHLRSVHFTYTIWLLWRMSFILQYFWGWIDDAVSDTVLTLQKIHVREGTTLACTICRWNNKCMWASIISNQRPFPQRRNLLLCLKFRLSMVYCQHIV